MACISGKNIVQDGLVLSVDMANKPKSFFGRPTTNIIGPANDATNIYMPSNRPYSGLPHSQAGNFNNNVTTEVPPPVTGQTVYKVMDDGFDTQPSRYSVRIDMRNTWIDYDKTYIWSAYVWLPSEFAGRWTGSLLAEVYQNSTGTDWHGVRGFSSQFNYYGAGNIETAGPYGNQSSIDITKLDQWQRIWVAFTPLTANIQLPENGGNDNNFWVAGYMRVNINSAINGGTPFHLYMSAGQIEEGDFVTEFVQNSRAATDSIKDVTNNNVFTPLNLSFDDLDTFSFPGDGSTPSRLRSDKTRTTLLTDPNIFSYEVVCKRNGAGSTSVIVIGSQGFNNGILMNTNGSFVASSWYNLSGTWTAATPYPVTPAVANDTWAHVTMTFNKNGFQRIYLNGELRASLDVSNFTTLSSDNWRGETDLLEIGGGSFAPYCFPGTIAVAKMYDKELTAQEVKQNFEATRSRYGI